jgi:hypothetical protein
VPAVNQACTQMCADAPAIDIAHGSDNHAAYRSMNERRMHWPQDGHRAVARMGHDRDPRRPLTIGLRRICYVMQLVFLWLRQRPAIRLRIIFDFRRDLAESA